MTPESGPPVEPPRPARELVHGVIQRGYQLQRRRRLLLASPAVAMVLLAGALTVSLWPEGSRQHVVVRGDKTTMPRAGAPTTAATPGAGGGPTTAVTTTPARGALAPRPTVGSTAPRIAPLMAWVQRPRNGKGRIVVLPRGGAATYLTNGAQDDFAPAVSPGGARIAFASDRNNAVAGVRTVYQVFVMNADGGGVQQLTRAPVQGGNGNSNPTWSPDGTQLAFGGDDANDHGEIYVVGVDGNGQRKITTSAASALRPAWSPDGGRIAYFVGAGAGLQLWTVRPDGSGAASVGPRREYDTQNMTWSADSRSVIVSVRSGERLTLHEVDVANGQDHALAIPSLATAPSMCGQDQLAYVRQDRALDPRTVVLVGLDGSNPRTMNRVPSGLEDDHPACA